MARCTVRNQKLFVNGEYVPVSRNTVGIAVWMNARGEGKALPGPGEHEITDALAQCILLVEHEIALSSLENALLESEERKGVA